MDEPEDLIGRVSCLIARSVLTTSAGWPVEVQLAQIIPRLDLLQPGGGTRLVMRLQAGRPLAVALRATLYDYIASEVARLLGALEGTHVALGLGAAPPSVTQFSEKDDVVQHNDAPTPKKVKDWTEWQAHLYRGLWYPGYMTAINDLTPDDVGLASAYLAGKLTAKGCPKSDWARHQEARANLAYRIVHGIEMIAGIVASVVLTVFYGPIGGALTGLLHRAKMKVIDHFWKLKVVRDPAFRALIEKLQPGEWYTASGFRFQLRPWGNMLVKELGCTADFQSRLLMHGRMVRTLDVLAASSPTAASAPGRYDYVSSFGPLKGSIFPPRGPESDGVPAPPEVEAQAKQIIDSAPVQAAINQPTASLSATAQFMTTGFKVPDGVLKSAAMLKQKIGAQQTAQLAHARKEKPATKHWPWILGGAALGAAILATR